MKVNVYVNWEAGSIITKPETIISGWTETSESDDSILEDWLCGDEDLTLADLFHMSESVKQKLKGRWHDYCADEAYARFEDEYQLVVLDV